MKNFLFLSIFLFSILSTNAQSRFDKAEIKTHKITDQIHYLEGSGGNIGVLIGDEGVLIIDDQYAPLSGKIKKAIKELSDHPVKYVVNTHWHGDHTGGNGNFGKTGSIIIAQENVLARMSTEQVNKAWDKPRPPSLEEAWPEITFNEDMKIHFNGQNVVLIHVHNAHTDGDTFVWFPKSNVIHMGDCFFNGRFPYIDLGSGGSVDGAIRAVQLALSLTDSNSKIIPGHGQLATKSDLMQYHKMLNVMRDRVKNAIADGKTIEEIKAAHLDAGYEEWGKAFINSEKIIDIIWTDLSR